MADQGETPTTPSGLRDELTGLPVGEMTKTLLAAQERRPELEFVTVTYRKIIIKVPRAVAEMTRQWIEENYDSLVEEEEERPYEWSLNKDSMLDVLGRGCGELVDVSHGGVTVRVPQELAAGTLRALQQKEASEGGTFAAQVAAAISRQSKLKISCGFKPTEESGENNG